MKSKLLAIFLLAGSSIFAGPRFSIGIGVGVGGYRPYGGYYSAPVVAPRVVYAPAPVYPAYAGPTYVAPAPYYVRPPFRGAVWVGPRWIGGRHYAGYWRR